MPDDAWFTSAPRPHPMRLRRESYPITEPIGARYADMDVYGHLNNLALETMHENSRATLNQRALPGVYDPGERSIRLVSAQNVVHFLAEAHWPAQMTAGVGVARVGRTSYVASSGLFLDDTCIGLCDTVLVAVDGNGEPTPLPEDTLQALGGMQLRDTRH
jgi:acyl-CoA thioester hydrolase